MKKKLSQKAERPPKISRIIPLVLEERARLIALLNDPIMQKALANAALVKPPSSFAGSGVQVSAVPSAELAMLMANNRLHQIQGWETFETALFAQTLDPKSPRAQVEENYPDSANENS